MVKDTIKTVKAAEQDASKIAKETEKKQAQMLLDAKEKVFALRKSLESELLAKRERELLETTRHNDSLLEQALSEAREEAELLHKQAEIKKEEVFQLIMDELIG